MLRFLFTGNTPPIITPRDTRRKLIELFELDKGSVFYDLGCGDATFLIELSKKFPDSKFVGIENSLFYYLLSKINIALHRRTKIQILFGNFFKIDLTPATHIYSWIFSKDMDRLFNKIKAQRDMKKTLYSLGFPLTEVKASKVITLDENKRFAHTLYIYTV